MHGYTDRTCSLPNNEVASYFKRNSWDCGDIRGLSITGVDWLGGIFCVLGLGMERAGLPTLNSEVYLGRGDRIAIRVIALSKQRQCDLVVLKFTRTNFY